jgi:hypothetical protein
MGVDFQIGERQQVGLRVAGLLLGTGMSGESSCAFSARPLGFTFLIPPPHQCHSLADRPRCIDLGRPSSPNLTLTIATAILLFTTLVPKWPPTGC